MYDGGARNEVKNGQKKKKLVLFLNFFWNVSILCM